MSWICTNMKLIFSYFFVFNFFFLKISKCSQENSCVGVLFLIKIPKEVFSCEYYEIFKNTYFEEHLHELLLRNGMNLFGSLCFVKSHVLYLFFRKDVVEPKEFLEGINQNLLYRFRLVFHGELLIENSHSFMMASAFPS